jgi:L-aminopeptidase/D-esterase-like protein
MSADGNRGVNDEGDRDGAGRRCGEPLAGLGVAGVRVGHWTDREAETGCTVVELPPGTVASYEARGGAPASREVELLRPDKVVSAVDAVLLTGGSAFGLAATDGVMRYYEQTGRGFPTPAGIVPIVPALALFDLGAGGSAVRPNAEHGYLAAQATRQAPVVSGRVGAGAGAYVGHWRGPSGRRPAGLASHVLRLGDLVVGVLCAVNAFGDIDQGGDDGAGLGAIERLRDLSPGFAGGLAGDRTHTTIGVVCTNARLDKTGCLIVAQGAHDGLSRAITPPHTRRDGDAFIAAATGEVEADVDVVRLMALTAVCRAIRSVG